MLIRSYYIVCMSMIQHRQQGECMKPLPCANCGWRTAQLCNDGIFYFLMCEKCGKSGLRESSREGAIDQWNDRGADMFLYGEDREKYTVTAVLECTDRRDDTRFKVNCPVVLAMGSPKGPRASGRVKNVSLYGAFIELVSGDMSGIPVQQGELQKQEGFLFCKVPEADPLGAGLVTQMFPFGPTHLHMDTTSLSLGGRFVKQRQEHVQALERLIAAHKSRWNLET